MAKLYFRYGAMNSGKTMALLQVAYNYEERDQRVFIVKSTIDTKGEDSIVSRIGPSRKVDYFINPTDSVISLIKNNLEGISCILVDEAQFFNSNQIFDFLLITKQYDIPVICYGLRADFMTNSFPGSKRLFELADELEELVTICRCGKKAKFNARMVNSKFVSEGEQVAIDEKDDVSYESLCGHCYIKKVLKIKKD